MPSNSSRFRRLQKKKRRVTRTARPTAPPTAPPTIAPVCEDEDEELPLVVSTPAVPDDTTVLVMTDVKTEPLEFVPLPRGKRKQENRY